MSIPLTLFVLSPIIFTILIYLFLLKKSSSRNYFLGLNICVFSVLIYLIAYSGIIKNDPHGGRTLLLGLLYLIAHNLVLGTYTLNKVHYDN
jgi:drug/metabolite transporter (DMT)-like permease